MTDRVHSLLVVLENDVREDDIQNFIDVLSRMRGVAGVEKCVSDYGTHMAEKRAHQKWREKILALLDSVE